MVGLGALESGGYSSALGVSADGSVVVGQDSGPLQTQESFRWTVGGGMEGLGFLPGGTSTGNGAALGVSADGSVVVGISNSAATDLEAYIWTESAGMIGLGFLGTGEQQSWANAVSADGSVVVGVSYPTTGGSAEGTSEAFRWTAGSGMVGLGFLPGGVLSEALAASADGSVLVGWGDFGDPAAASQAFRWTSGSGMVGLGRLPGDSFSEAHGVSADGSVVVGLSQGGDPVYDQTAFIWDATNGMRSLPQVLTDSGLDLSGWVLDSATGISADGLTIAGNGTNPLGQHEAWIAFLPEPGTPLLLLTALLALATRAKRLV
jgi:probable HAF family extracellular repeat protein